MSPTSDASLNGIANTEEPVRVVLLGIGKSGTTALMSALSQSLSVPYVMEPSNLNDIQSEGSVVVKKLVDNFVPGEEEALSQFNKIVFLVRDPRDSLVSRILYRPYGLRAFAEDDAVRRYLEVIERKIREPASVPFKEIMRALREISGYMPLRAARTFNNKFTDLFGRFRDKSLLIKYEDFADGRVEDLEKYLGVSLPPLIEVDEKFRRVSRKRGYGDWKNWFTKKDAAFLNDAFGEFIDAFGYGFESPNAVQVIDRAESVLYVVKVVNEWRSRRGIPPYHLGPSCEAPQRSAATTA